MWIFVVVVALAVFLSYFGLPFLEKSISYKAKVVSKEHWGGEGRGAFAAGRFFVPVAPVCRITFELGNSKSVTLIVPGKIYDELSVGSKGMLEYTARNERFKNFTVAETLDKQNFETQKNNFIAE